MTSPEILAWPEERFLTEILLLHAEALQQKCAPVGKPIPLRNFYLQINGTVDYILAWPGRRLRLLEPLHYWQDLGLESLRTQLLFACLRYRTRNDHPVHVTIDTRELGNSHERLTRCQLFQQALEGLFSPAASQAIIETP